MKVVVQLKVIVPQNKKIFEQYAADNMDNKSKNFNRKGYVSWHGDHFYVYKWHQNVPSNQTVEKEREEVNNRISTDYTFLWLS